MSTAQTVSAAPVTPEPAPVWFATLKRGRVYYLRDRLFEQGIEQVVSEEVKVYLEEFAIDEVSVEDENEFQARPKFVFRQGDVDSTASAASAQRPRSRAR
jgi:hypothetical protein